MRMPRTAGAVHQTIILAAGVGARLDSSGGGVPKPLLTVAGVPLIAHALAHAAASKCREAIIVIGHQGARVRAAVEEMVARTGPDATVVAFAHGAVIGELCRQATDSRPFAFVHADNGSLSRLVVQADGRWLLRSFNDISHLTVTTGPAG
jgi:hypothetical protein